MISHTAFSEFQFHFNSPQNDSSIRRDGKSSIDRNSLGRNHRPNNRRGAHLSEVSKSDKSLTGIVIIASGKSRRPGTGQLAKWRSRSSIRHMASVALDSGLGPVTVVVGAEDQMSLEALHGLPLSIVFNPPGESGVGVSIAIGVTSMMDLEPTDIIVMLCDQPEISAAHLQKLKDESRSCLNAIVATRHHGNNSAPVLFPTRFLPHLRMLRGSQEPRSLLHGTVALSWVSCPDESHDAATSEDTGGSNHLNVRNGSRELNQ